jgi:biopolymer transport protein ExbB
MHERFVEEIQYYVSQGGTVMWPLVAGIFVLWYALGYRMFILRRGTGMDVRRLVEKSPAGKGRGIIDSAVIRALQVVREAPRDLRGRLDFEFSGYLEQMGKGSVLARSIVLVAPLAGLLGTVNGMIEMFDSLGTQTVYSQSGGVARGIAEALFTTQLGLAIAVPGFIVARILERRERQIATELDQLKGILCAGAGGVKS